MHKIFRKNRQHSLNKGKAGQYLKYAVGEITLIVLGILIALYLNYKNSKRIEENTTVTVYENIKRQITTDKNTLNQSKTNNRKFNDKFLYAANIIKQNDRKKIDTLGQLAFELSVYSGFDRSSTIYQNLLNSGESKLLQNRGILDQIQKLEEGYLFVNRIDKIHFEIISITGPDIFKTIKFSDMSVRDPEKLFGIDFQNYFVSAILICKDKEYAYNRAIDDIESLEKLIDKELSNQ